MTASRQSVGWTAPRATFGGCSSWSSDPAALERPPFCPSCASASTVSSCTTSTRSAYRVARTSPGVTGRTSAGCNARCACRPTASTCCSRGRRRLASCSRRHRLPRFDGGRRLPARLRRRDPPDASAGTWPGVARATGAELSSYFHWAAWMRGHAADPTHRPEVIRHPDSDAEMVWSRWSDWRSGDPRWRVHVVDTSAMPVDSVADALAEWMAVERARWGSVDA